MTRHFSSLDEFKAAIGEELGPSEWHTVTQDQINLFADATGDHQWIHVDEEKAKDGPFGTTIAHGYLTLSLLPILSAEVYSIDSLTFGLNYGANKIRFPSAVPVNSRIRAWGKLLDIVQTPIGNQATIQFTIEREGSEKPVCVAEVIYVMG